MKQVLLGTLLTLATVNAVAQETESANKFVMGIGYMNLSMDEGDGIDYDLGAVVGSIGYKINAGNNFYITPELRVGAGASNDSLNLDIGWVEDIYFGEVDVDVELKQFLAFSVRAQFELDNGLYFYVAPSYAKAEFEVEVCGTGTWIVDYYYGSYIESASACATTKDDSWESGFGAGAGFNIGNTVAIEVSVESFGDADVYSAGLKFKF